MDLADDLGAFERRAACSDAERRAALFLHDELRAAGHEAWVETVWTRPGWAGSLFWHALLGVVASLLATGVPVAGVAVAGVVLASWFVGLTGRAPLLDRVTRARRATQLVLVEPEDPDAEVAVWLHAATDAARGGLGARVARRRETGWVLAVALVLVLAAAVARLAGSEADLGVLQFVPTLVLLVVAGAGIDAVLAEPGDGAAEAGGVAAAVDAFEALRADPPPGLSAGLLLGGAGSEAAPLALREWLRATRPDPLRTLLVMVGPAAGDAVAWSARRPQLRTAFGEIGISRTRSGGSRSRVARRLPQVAIGGGEPEALADAIVAGLDRLELQPVRSRA